MKRVLVLAVLTGCMALTPGADARARRIETNITATFTDTEPVLPIPGLPDAPDTFSGRVSSPNAKCVDGRSIKVVKKNADGETLGVAAVATSKPDGTWTTNKEDPTPGTYVAVATRKAISGEGRPKICLAAESSEMTVE